MGLNFREEIWEPRAELDICPQLTEALIGETAQRPILYVTQKVVEIDSVFRGTNTLPCIEAWKLIGFSPEGGLVHAVSTEEGSLHVSRNESFIKVPDTSEHVAGA